MAVAAVLAAVMLRAGRGFASAGSEAVDVGDATGATTTHPLAPLPPNPEHHAAFVSRLMLSNPARTPRRMCAPSPRHALHPPLQDCGLWHAAISPRSTSADLRRRASTTALGSSEPRRSRLHMPRPLASSRCAARPRPAASVRRLASRKPCRDDGAPVLAAWLRGNRGRAIPLMSGIDALTCLRPLASC